MSYQRNKAIIPVVVSYTQKFHINAQILQLHVQSNPLSSSVKYVEISRQTKQGD